VRILDELCLQGHLLSRSFMLTLERRFGNEAAARIGAHQLTGIAGLTAKRLVRMLGTSGGLADVARVLDLHPAFRPPAYIDFHVDGSDELVVTIGPCAALDEGDGLTWPALLVGGHADAAFSAIAQAVDPRATSTRIEAPGPAKAAWRISLDRNAEPAPDSKDVALASFSTGAEFKFADRGR
jgi:hypothetical protein